MEKPPPAEPPRAAEPEAAAGPAKKGLSDEAKQARHWQRTRKGMLKWLAEQGGTATLADMHTKSESKYFVAHRQFSRLMEEFTEQGLVNYSGATGIVELTEAGRAGG